jgi:hypothetical protein
MSLQPIDLQTLFVRLSQIGKEQAALKESAVVQQELHGNEIAKRSRMQDETVNRTHELEEESGKVQEKKEGSPQSGGRGEQEEYTKSGKGREKKKRNVFEDPALGKNIDISG